MKKLVAGILLVMVTLCSLNVGYAWNNNPPLTKDQAFEKSTGAIHQQGYTMNNTKPNINGTQWKSWGSTYKRVYIYKNSHYRQVGTVLGWQYNDTYAEPIKVTQKKVTTSSLSKTVSAQLSSKVGANIEILSKDLCKQLGMKYTKSTTNSESTSVTTTLNLPKYTKGRYYGIGMFQWIDEYKAITYKKVGKSWEIQSWEIVYIFYQKPNQHLMWKYGTGK